MKAYVIKKLDRYVKSYHKSYCKNVNIEYKYSDTLDIDKAKIYVNRKKAQIAVNKIGGTIEEIDINFR